MTTLGIDPGTATVGWCLLEDGKLLDHGAFQGDPRFSKDWKRRRDGLIVQIAHLLHETRPDLVAIEATQTSARTDDGKSVKQMFSMAQNSQRTEELAGMIGMEAYRQAGEDNRQVEVVRIHPATGLARLGLKRGATDRQTSEAFNLRFGKKLLVRDHHEARAAGVAMAAEAKAKMTKRGAA